MKRFWLFLFLSGALLGAAPLRVVSLSPAVTETIFFLGGERRLAGRSRACDAPAAAKSLPVAGDFGIADVEKILQLHPDAVIVHHLVNANAERVLNRNGIKVLRVPCETWEDYCAMVRKLGEWLDCRAAATREVARVREKLAIWEKRPALPQKVLVVVWQKPLIVAGEKTFCGELICFAGAQNVDFKGKPGYFAPDVEFLLQNEPDVLLCLFPVTDLGKHPVLGKLRAVKAQKVIFPADADGFQRPSPRWCDAVDALRKELEGEK